MDKIPWKPEKTGFAAWDEKVSSQSSHKKPPQDSVNEPSEQNKVQDSDPKPESNIWEQRALWIIIGVFVAVGILWLASASSKIGQDYLDEYDMCDGSRNAYCP